jgi:hypothetical protein
MGHVASLLFLGLTVLKYLCGALAGTVGRNPDFSLAGDEAQ